MSIEKVWDVDGPRSSNAFASRRNLARSFNKEDAGMSMIAALLQELEKEAQTTRRVLERVPADRLSWKPHEKSMSLGQLALHIATVPGAIAEISKMSPFSMGHFNQPAAANAADLLPAL